MSLPAASAHPGMILGSRYELQEPIASGGMAQVWRGLDVSLDRAVAVKLLHPHLAGDGAFVTRFRREAIAAAKLSHPSIVAIYDTLSEQGVEAIVMELITGRTLRDALNEVRILPPADLVNVGVQVADALDVAHRAGVVHRDIKPANIMISNDRRVLVADFGIAKANKDDDLTHTGTLLGTAKYLAPEQVAGETVDPRADLYALGIVLFECATGDPPFNAGTDAATALARLQQDAPRARHRRPEVPVGLDAVIAKALARDPNQRYDRATSMRAALAAVDLTQVRSDTSDLPTPIMAPPTLTNQPAVPSSSLDSLPAPPAAPNPAPSPTPPGTAVLPQQTSGGQPGQAPATTPKEARKRAKKAAKAQRSRSRRLGSRLLYFGGIGLGGLLALFVLLGIAEELTGSGGVALTTTSAVPFDPEGTPPFRERNASAGFAIDGDPSSAWATEGYNQPSLSGLKSGVGLIVTLDGTHTLNRLSLDTGSDDWDIEVYVNDNNDFGANGTDFEPSAFQQAGTAEGDSGERTIDLNGASGSSVLLWITETGLPPNSEDGKYRFVLKEITLIGE